MALFSVSNIAIKGIAACVPKNCENNIDYDWISLPERELLIKTTGIEKRRIASDEICTSDMCFSAAEKLINDLKIDKNEIDILIFVSQSPDYFLPATSIILQNKLGLKNTTMAFDIQLGCSGYVYGLSIISSLMNSGNFKKGLLLVGDKSSFSQSKKDKSTYPIFGDAGTATIVEYDTSASKIDFNQQSDGAGFESIIIPDGGVRSPWNKHSDDIIKVSEGIERSKRNLHLDGLEVFNFSLREVAPNIRALMEFNGTTIENYDYFVLHQANKLMNENIRKKLKLPLEKVPYSIQDFGNTSSASIPITIVTQIPQEKLKGELSLIISGFGVGLSWGSASLKLKNVYCPNLIEI